MLDAWCERHGARVLVTPGQITGLIAHEGGFLVRFHCVCGGEGATFVAVRDECPRRRYPAAQREVA